MKNTATNDLHLATGKRRLELEAPHDRIVHLWVQRDRADACLSTLEKLLHCNRTQGGGQLKGYRFLGANRICRAGVDFLRMSFCPECRNGPSVKQQVDNDWH